MALTKTEEYNRAGRRVFNYLTKLKLDPDMAFQILLSGIANVMSRFCDDCFEA